MNAIAFRLNSIETVGQEQFVAYYNDDRSLVVARRVLGSDDWLLHDTGFVDLYSGGDDDHNVISFGIDGDGFMHMAWGMHNNPMLYSRSSNPVTGGGVLTFDSPGSMTGVNENAVTYPQFYHASDGDLLLLYRNGAAGNGDTQVNRYDRSAGQWLSVQKPLFDGDVPNDGIPSVNAYPQTWATDSQGDIHFVWTSRYQGDSPAGESGYQTNHNFFYARSPDEGVTWTRSDGSTYQPIARTTAPISEFNAEIAIPIPEGSSLINQASMTIDRDDRPVLASWWAPGASDGDHTRQYMLGWYDGAQWQTSQITNRPPEDKQSEATVRDLGRPIVVVDEHNRTIVAMRYKEAGNVLTIAHSTDRQDWEFLDLTTEDLGVFEPTYDRELWERENKLNIYYQPAETGSESTPVSVLEWNADAYFESLASPLLMSVNQFSGAVTLLNRGDSPISISGYAVDSESGAIAFNSWASLSSTLASGWEEAESGEHRVSESNPTGASVVEVGGSIELGLFFDPEQLAFGQDAPADFAFEYTLPGGEALAGAVEYVDASSNNLYLEVDRETGRVRLVNGSDHGLEIDSYVIRSQSGLLDPSDDGWISLEDSGSLGGVWDEANPSSGRLVELVPYGASRVAPGIELELGLAYSGSGTADLSFEFLAAAAIDTQPGLVRYLELGLPGDFNEDGSVDAADYALWRIALGSSTTLPNDLTPGEVGMTDYEVWRSFFGFTRSSQAAPLTTAPEPVGWQLFGLALISGANRSRRRIGLPPIHEPPLPPSPSRRP